jgi:hypothetical protein
MSYLDEIAAEIKRRLPPELLPDRDTTPLFRLYAVLALSKGRQVTAPDVHNAWAAWMQERDPSHSSIKPFGELDPETRAADDPYVEAIRDVASEHGYGVD